MILEDLLAYAMENGIIDIDAVSRQVEDMKRKEFLAMHTYKISATKEGGYATYLVDLDGKRMYRRRKTRKELEDLIVTHYKKYGDITTIKTVFDEWIDEKLEYGEIWKATYDRYQDHYRRFFKGKTIKKVPFKDITEEHLDRFIKSTIKSQGLSRKAYQGMRILIRGMFKYGKRRKLTSISITQFFGDLELHKNMFRKSVKPIEEEIFMEDEIPIVVKYMME